MTEIPRNRRRIVAVKIFIREILHCRSEYVNLSGFILVCLTNNLSFLCAFVLR